jgi:hypothetical protein
MFVHHRSILNSGIVKRALSVSESFARLERCGIAAAGIKELGQRPSLPKCKKICEHEKELLIIRSQSDI